MKKSLKKALTKETKTTKKEKVEKNVTATKKKDGVEEAIIQGNPLDHNVKQSPQDLAKDLPETVKVGMSIGLTKNMDNYESLRVDVWFSDIVSIDSDIDEAYRNIAEMLKETLEKTVEDLTN